MSQLVINPQGDGEDTRISRGGSLADVFVRVTNHILDEVNNWYGNCGFRVVITSKGLTDEQKSD